jgi:transposase
MTPGKNQKCFIAGAFEPKRQRLVYAEGDRKASWLFLNLLRALLEAYARAGRIYVILDNHVIHQHGIVECRLRDHGGKIHLYFLPPYCPEANRSERIWLNLHNNVMRNHRCRALAEMMSNIRRSFMPGSGIIIQLLANHAKALRR